ncbi:hypothetical protein [Pseudomonas sp. Hp2]|uniref:hypothetical protein n=1 Tax=Pseudomonas sp. Hp2 TaxID=701189 RepID=UPI0011269903|nr:hypothetical protein [Pseudomonas sp. Hp2]
MGLPAELLEPIQHPSYRAPISRGRAPVLDLEKYRHRLIADAVARSVDEENARRAEQEKAKQAEIDRRLARHVASFEDMRAKIVDLLTLYGWEVDPDPETHRHGVLCFQKGTLWFITETSGWPRLLKELQAQPSKWGVLPQRKQKVEAVDWLDWRFGTLPLPYHLTQWIEENEMALSNQDKLDIKAMIAEGVAAGLKDYSIPVGKISFSTGQVVAIVSVIFAGVIAVGGAIIGGSIYVHHGLGKVEAEVAALSVKVDERLPAQQSPTSTDSGSSKPPTTKDDPATP